MNHSLPLLTPRQTWAWRGVQFTVWAVGVTIVVMLLVVPKAGIVALWNVLVPIAPALLVFAPGIWRNVCPLGSTALWARHMGLSRARRLSKAAQGWLALLGLALLLLIVPLRHLVLDTNGPVTGVILIAVGLLAAGMGFVFEWKSGWCSGPCPVHPVEKLYGSRPALTVPNAHCSPCQMCTAVCPDSTPCMTPVRHPSTIGHRLTATILVGGFPGYIWGWFQVSDAVGFTPDGIGRAFGMPFAGLAATLAVYLVLRRLAPQREDLLTRIFGAAAVSCYYWFRLPMLVGLGRFPGEGVLVDLSDWLPAWTPLAMHAITTAVFFWWIVIAPVRRRSWAVRPPIAPGVSAA